METLEPNASPADQAPPGAPGPSSAPALSDAEAALLELADARRDVRNEAVRFYRLGQKLDRCMNQGLYKMPSLRRKKDEEPPARKEDRLEPDREHMCLRVFRYFRPEDLDNCGAREQHLMILTGATRASGGPICSPFLARALLPICEWVKAAQLRHGLRQGRRKYSECGDMQLAIDTAVDETYKGPPPRIRPKKIYYSPPAHPDGTGPGPEWNEGPGPSPDDGRGANPDDGRGPSHDTRRTRHAENDDHAQNPDSPLDLSDPLGADDPPDGSAPSPNEPLFSDEIRMDIKIDRVRTREGEPYATDNTLEQAALKYVCWFRCFDALHDQFMHEWDAGLPMDSAYHRDLSESAESAAEKFRSLRHLLRKGADIQAGHDQKRAEEDAVRQEKLAERITLCAHVHTAQHGALGLTVAEPLRITSLDCGAGQTSLSIGGIGQGKSTLATVIAENNCCPSPGLASGPAGCTVDLWSDWQTGSYEPERLAGFEPNQSDHDQRRLLHYFMAYPDRFRRGVYWAMPDQLERAQDELRPLVNQGRLRVLPIGLHPAGMNKLGVQALLRAGENSKEPQYMTFVWDVFRNHGTRITPRILHRAIDDSRMKRDQKELARRCVSLLEKLWTTERRMTDGVIPETMNFVDFRSEWIDGSDVMPLSLAVLTDFVKGADPRFMLWILLDELNKYEKMPMLAAYIRTLLAEIRHRLISVMLSAQGVDELVKEILPLAKLVAVFRLESAEMYARIQRLRAAYRNVPFEVIAALAVGQAMVTALESSDPTWTQTAQGVWVRPTITQPGGHTRRVG